MNAMYPEALIIEPMKINKIPDGKEHMFPSLCESGEYFAQLKKDGYWYMYEKTENHAYLFSRTTSAVTGTLAEKSANVPHIMEVLNHLPAGTILIGEIYYPGKRSKDVTPIMGSLPEKAIERQNGEYGPLHYYIHDMIRYKGKDLTSCGAGIRYDLLKRVFDLHLLGNYTIDDNHFIELAERVDENIQEFVADALERGEEGAVLKKKTAPYTPGKRPAWDTIKIKKTDTCDAICIGFNAPSFEYMGKEIETWPYWAIKSAVVKEGEEDQPLVDYRRVPPQSCYKQHQEHPDLWIPVTKAWFYGWCNSMRVGAYDENGKIIEIGTVSSGLTEEMQANASEKPWIYLNKVVKLAGMEKDREAKTLRHFFFKGFHEDKNPEECTLKEIF